MSNERSKRTNAFRGWLNPSSEMTYEEFLKFLHLHTDDEDSDKNDEDKGGQNGK